MSTLYPTGRFFSFMNHFKYNKDYHYYIFKTDGSSFYFRNYKSGNDFDMSFVLARAYSIKLVELIKIKGDKL